MVWLMETIPSTEFSKKVGAYLTRAARGETLLITQYGRPYVVLSPPPRDLLDQDQEPPAGAPD